MAAPEWGSPDAFASQMFADVVGAGASSRLFQQLREDQGLAYAIYSELNPFRDTGSLCIFAGTAVDKTREVVQLTMQELRRLKEDTVGEGELKRAKDQLKSNIVIGLESSGSRMANLARQEMYFGRFFGVDEITREIEAVTTADIQSLAQQLFRPEAIALTLLGNLGEMEIGREDLAC